MAYGGGGGGSGGYGGSYGGGSGSTSTARSFLGHDDEDLKRRSKMVTRMFPALKKRPKFVLSLVQQDVPDDELSSQVAKTAGFSMVQNRIKSMAGLAPVRQQGIWNSFDPTMKSLMKKGGYQPPNISGVGAGSTGHTDDELLEIAVRYRKASPTSYEQSAQASADVGFAFQGVSRERLARIAKKAGVPDRGDVTDTMNFEGMRNAIESVKAKQNLLEHGVHGASISRGLGQLQGAAGGIPVVGGAVGGTLGAIRTVSELGEEYVAEPALGLANVVGGFPAQYYRTAQALGHDPTAPVGGPGAQLEGGLEGLGGLLLPITQGFKAAAAAITGDDPEQVKHFTNAWEEAANGESFFGSRAVGSARSQLKGNESQLDLAKQIASGTEIEEIASKYGQRGTKAYEEAYLELSGLSASESFQDAVQTLANGKVSFGRDLARNYGVDPSSPGGQLLSGAGDALFTWYADPLLIAGSVRHAWKAAEGITKVSQVRAWQGFEDAKLALQHGDDWARLGLGPEELMKTGAPRHAMAQAMADALKSGASVEALSALFVERYPKLMGVIPALEKENRRLREINLDWAVEALGRPLTIEEAAKVPGIYNTDDIFNFYGRTEGLVNLVKGTWQPGRVGVYTLPKMTRVGMATAEVRAFAKRTINFAARGDEVRPVPLGVDDVVAAQRPLVEDVTQGQLFTTRAPAAPGYRPMTETEFVAQYREAGEGVTAQALYREHVRKGTVPDVFGAPEGETRMYRVQVGTGARAPAPGDPGIRSPQWFSDDLSHAQLAGMPMQHYGTVRYVDVPTTEVQAFREGASGGFILPQDLAAESKILGPTGDFAMVNGKVLPKPIRWVVGPPARVLQMLSRQVPGDEVISLYGPKMPKQVAALLDMSYMDSTSKGEIFSAIMRADNPAIRREMVRSVMERMFHASGQYESDAGRDIAARYVDVLYQQYADNGLDLMFKGSQASAEGLLPFADHAVQIAMPSYRDVRAQAKRIGIMEAVFGAVNQPWADAFTSKYWKPAMLLTPKFPFRAGADEAMSTILRSPSAYKERLGMKLLYDDKNLPSLNQRLREAIDEIEVFLDDGTITVEDVPTKMAELLTSKATGWHRWLGEKLIPPNLRRAARLVSEQPELARANFAGLSQVMASRTTYGLDELGEIPPGAISIPIDAEGSEYMLMIPSRSAFRTYSGSDIERLPSLLHGTHRFIHEPAGRDLVAARQLYVNRTQEAAVYGVFSRIFPDVTDGYEMSARIRADMKAAPRFRRAFAIAMETERDLGRTDDFANAIADMAEHSRQSEVLSALVENFNTLPRDTRFTFLLDKDKVLRRLIRPEVELDDLQRQLYGSALDNNPEAYLDELFDRLPEVAEGNVRWYVPMGADADQIRDIERLPPAEWLRDMPHYNDMPWRAGTYEEDEIRAMIRKNLKRAGRGEDVGLRGVSFVDIPFSRIDGPIQARWSSLPVSYREEALPFADDIGTQFDDIRAWHTGVDSERIKYWDNLAEEALAGNAEAARTLGHEAVVRSLEHPINARYQREMMRGNMHSTDGPVLKPPQDGMVAVYYPTFHTRDAETARLAVNRTSATGRRFLDTEMNMPQATRELEELGQGPQFPISRWASSDFEEVRSFADEIEDGAKQVNQPIKVGMARIDIPEEDIRKYFRVTEGAGSHDYEMSLANGLRGEAIDRSAPYVSTASPELADMEQLDTLLINLEYSAEEAINQRWEHKYELADTDEALRNIEREHNLALEAAPEDLGRGLATPEVREVWADERLGELVDRFIPDSTDPGWLRKFRDRLRQARGTTGNGTTYRGALEDHGDKLNSRFDQLFMTDDQRVIHELTVRGAERGGIDPAWIYNEQIPLPNTVTGPLRYQPGAESLLERATRLGFDHYVTPIVDAMNRTPLWTHNFLRRVTAAESLIRPSMVDPELLAQMEPIAAKLGTTTDEVYDLFRRAGSDSSMVERALEEGVIPEQVFFKIDMARVEHYAELGVLPKNMLHLSEDEWKTVHGFMDNEANIRKTVADSAAFGAEGDTIPFIDDHRVRSQFAEEIRNISPFWWAQEAFFRRWAKTIAHSPEAIRKGQLIVQGARHAGLTYEGPDGRQQFMIPGTQQLWETINKAASAFPILGNNLPVIPVPVGIAGDLRLASPGFDAVGVPGYSAFIGIPLAIARPHFPEVDAVEEGALGERGADRGILEQLVPSWAAGVYKAISGHPETDAQLSSAMVQAMQYMEAHDLAPGDNATAFEQQRYIDRVENWAHTLLFFRTAFALVDPAPPVLQIGDVDLAPEFQKLLRNLPLDVAISEFVKRHPDATPYTVFQTKSKAGATLSGSEEAGRWLEANRDFVERYPLASSWMMPQPKWNDIASRRVYQRQQELGLRERKMPEEWYADLKFAQSSDVYFDSSAAYERARAKAEDDSERKAELDRSWANWKSDYFKKHPMFAEQLQSGEGQKRRQAVLDETNMALANPDLPDFAHKDELEDLLISYNRFEAEMSRMKGLRGTNATEERKSLRTSFYNWALGFVKGHPRVRSFYERVIDPELALSVVDQDQFAEGPDALKSSITRPAAMDGPIAARYASYSAEGADGPVNVSPRPNTKALPKVPTSKDIDPDIVGQAKREGTPLPTGGWTTQDAAEFRRLRRQYRDKGFVAVTDDSKYFILPGGRRVPTPTTKAKERII